MINNERKVLLLTQTIEFLLFLRFFSPLNTIKDRKTFNYVSGTKSLNTF